MRYREERVSPEGVEVREFFQGSSGLGHKFRQKQAAEDLTAAPVSVKNSDSQEAWLGAVALLGCNAYVRGDGVY